MNEETQRAMVELIKAVEKQYGPVDYVTMCEPFEESDYFKRIIAGTPAPRQHSSRRQLVQSKRKQLGLPVDGKVKPFWSDDEGNYCKPSRKDCLHAALQADKMMRVYAQLGDAEWRRQFLIQSWLGWSV